MIKIPNVVIEMKGSYINKERGNQPVSFGKREKVLTQNLQNIYNTATLKDAFCEVADLGPGTNYRTMKDSIQEYLQRNFKGQMRPQDIVDQFTATVNGRTVGNFDDKVTSHFVHEKTLSGKELDVLVFEFIVHVKGA